MANMLANIFGSSPVQPLEKHMDVVIAAPRSCGRLSTPSSTGSQRMAEVRGQIEALEHEADNLKKEIRLNMPKSLFMPVPREDLLELLLVQDKIANRTKDVSGVIMGAR